MSIKVFSIEEVVEACFKTWILIKVTQREVMIIKLQNRLKEISATQDHVRYIIYVKLDHIILKKIKQWKIYW